MPPSAPPPAPRLERLLVGLTLATLVWLPLPLGSNRDWAVGVLAALAGLLGAGLGLLAWRHPAPLAPAQRAALPLLGLLLAAQAWVALQWLAGLSRDTGATLQYLVLGLSYSLLFWLVVSLFQRGHRLRLLLWVLVLSGAYQAFWGAFKALSGSEGLFVTPFERATGSASGTFVNRNHLAGYLEMTLGLGIGLLLALRDRRPFAWVQLLELLLGPKARLRLALVIMVIGLVMTFSRSGNAAFLASLLLVGGAYGVLDRRHRLRNGLILASIVLVDVLVVSQFFGLEQLKDRVLNTRLEATVVDGRVLQANEYRDDVLRAALPLVAERPLAGHGAGSFEAVFPRMAGPGIPLHYDHAHNDYLQFLIEYGLAGALPLAAFALLALGRALRPLRRRDDAFASGVGVGAAMAILALLIHSATDFNLQIPANAATFVVVCAIAVLAAAHRPPTRRGAAS